MEEEVNLFLHSFLISSSDNSESAESLPGYLQQLVSGNYATLGVGALTLAGVAATYYLQSTSTKPIEPVVDLNNQSVIIDGKPEHRASWLANAPDYLTFDRMWPDVHTIYDVLEQGRKLSKNGPCLGTRSGPNREYQWISYQEVINRVHAFGSGLINRGFAPSNKFVGIYASNRAEWTISDFGCQAYSLCPVPLYDTLGVDGCKYILNECEMSVMVVDTEEKLQILIDLKPEVPFLKLVVVIEQFKAETRNAASKRGLELIQFYELLDLGKKNLKKPIPPKPSDLFSVVYTSGTTGNPKGAMLTHHSFVIMVDGILTHLMKHFTYRTDDVHMSYLPLAHVFDRAACVLVLMSGAQIGYYSRDLTALLDDFATLRPTIFPSVPRLFNRIYDSVMADVGQSKVKSTLLRWAMESKSREVNRRIIRRDSFWDKLLMKKIQNKIGGRVRLVISGSAPLSPEVMQFLRCAFGCPVLEGYGQTEAGAAITLTVCGDPGVGSVGPPLPSCHVKLTDIPEMNYYAKDNIGEVCAKGEIILQGYYKQPDKTKEAIDKDGWLHTGDVGTWLPNGTLKIVDRIKHIFKLSQGEYIAPEKIENVLQSQSFYLLNALLMETSHIMAVVVPDVIYLNKWAPNNGFPTDIKEFCQHKDAHDLIINDMLKYGQAAGLRGFEQVKDILLEPSLFSVDSGLLTPTLKNKRPQLRAAFKEKIQALYAKCGL
ncbi:unnamed protein product [Candidula unifasciata]|uniref:Long-chain-fatty-acid--CoA ligase n=1 Tax=Candidula unifasciata TaxID=100452 RepID=A0A8S4A5T5_9EUPU|nr:unnamed protein product [Candidula unifasciata]